MKPFFLISGRTLFTFVLFIAAGFLMPVFGQKGVKAFGLQFKPIFPLGLVNTDGIVVNDLENRSTLTIDETGGYTFGAVIRFGLTNRFSIETGINYARRNYAFGLTSPQFPSSSSELSFTGYELPLTGMVFVQLGEKMYMNASAGMSFDFFPTGGVVNYDRDTIEYGMLETSWIVYGLTANLGFEYRTEKSGYLYIGSSYHQPLSDMARVFISHRTPGTNIFTPLVSPPPGVIGTYLTIDIRYFFDPGMKEKRR